MTDSLHLLLKENQDPFTDSGSDDSNDECSRDTGLKRQSSTRWSLYIKGLTYSVAGFLLIIVGAITVVSVHHSRQCSSSVSNGLAASPAIDAATTTVSSLQPQATISCSFQPTLQQQRDEECIFDPILLAWMPKPCVNFPLLEATLNTTSEISYPPFEIAGMVAQQIYADPELTQQLSMHEVQQMKQNPYYVTLRFHRAHCAYLFRLVAESAGRKAMLDGNAARDIGVYGSDTIEEIPSDANKISAHGTYVWQEALRPNHVDHCIKILAWKGGDLDAPEKFYATAGRCILL